MVDASPSRFSFSHHPRSTSPVAMIRRSPRALVASERTFGGICKRRDLSSRSESCGVNAQHARVLGIPPNARRKCSRVVVCTGHEGQRVDHRRLLAPRWIGSVTDRLQAGQGPPAKVATRSLAAINPRFHPRRRGKSQLPPSTGLDGRSPSDRPDVAVKASDFLVGGVGGGRAFWRRLLARRPGRAWHSTR
jgi:hypothetical protein